MGPHDNQSVWACTLPRLNFIDKTLKIETIRELCCCDFWKEDPCNTVIHLKVGLLDYAVKQIHTC